MLKKIDRYLAGFWLIFFHSSVCLAASAAPVYNFSPEQNLLINISFTIAAAFVVLGCLTWHESNKQSGYYKKSTAFFLFFAGAVLFSITHAACLFSRSVIISTPLDVSGIAINSQLANLQINQQSGVYSLLPPSTIKLIIGGIMLIGWYSFIKGFYHLGRIGYTKESGHVQKFFSHVIAGVFAINITVIGPILISAILGGTGH